MEIVRVDGSNMTVSDSDPLTSYDRIRFRATVTDNEPDNNQYQLMLQAGTQGSNDAPGVCDIIETGIVVDNNPYDGGFTGNPPRNSIHIAWLIHLRIRPSPIKVRYILRLSNVVRVIAR